MNVIEMNVNKMSSEEVSKLTLFELRSICRENGYKGFSKYNKYELIQFMIQKMDMDTEKGNKSEPTSEDSLLPSGLLSPKKAEVVSDIVLLKKKNHNECLGRTVEYLLSKLYLNPNVDQIFKSELIDLQLVQKDVELFERVKDHYPYLEYIGNSDNKYDFKYVDIDNHQSVKYVSVKTNFNGYKVCPQVIGQTTLKKFRTYFQLDESYDIVKIKSYIIENISELLKAYIQNTFHCDILYYVKQKGKGKKSILKIIQYNSSKIGQIVFDPEKISFSHMVKNKEWNESTTVYYNVGEKRLSIGEFQIHNHRDNIKFRWSFQSLFDFLDLDIIQI